MRIVDSIFASAEAHDMRVVDGEYQLDNAALRAAVATLGGRLRELQCERVAILAGNGVGWIVADLAVADAELVCIPLPGFFSATQLTQIINSIGPDVILTDEPSRVLGLLAEHSTRPSLSVGFGLTLIHTGCDTGSALPEGTRKVTFTSGSTAAPKGVCLSSSNQYAVAGALRDALRLDKPRHLCLLPLCVLLENVGGVYVALLSAGCVVVPPAEATGFSGASNLSVADMCHSLDSYRPTSIILLPQMLVGLVAAMQAGWQPPPELRFAAVGGAKLPPGLVEAARRLQLPVYEGYGLSETASVVALNRPGCDAPGTAGRPLAHVSIASEDDELIVRGNHFLGYAGDRSTWYPEVIKTGDLGSIDAEGFVHIRGRSKNLLISSFGRNISPEWPESALLANSAIAECIVFGDGRPHCIALIRPASEAITDKGLQAVIDLANQDLPDFARVHSYIRITAAFSATQGLTTATGKPRRDAIARHYAAAIDGSYEQPRRAHCV